MDQEVIVWYTQIIKQHKNFRNLTNLDWVEAQRKDPVIPTVVGWIKWPRGDRRTLAEYLTGVASEYEKHFYAARQKEFVIQDNLLYLQATLTNSQDSTPVFVVPTKDRQVAINGCHHSAGHQGHDRMLSLMKGCFWWPGMSQAFAESCSQLQVVYSIRGQRPAPANAADHLH